MLNSTGYGLHTAQSALEPIEFKRRDLRPSDVALDILFCGVCHADVALARGEWGFGSYPCVPGHEIVGRVSAVGAKVSRHKRGDLLGVGPLVDSCRTCAACKDGHEQLCDVGFTPTYMGPDKDFGHTYGGYSNNIVVDENYTVRVPANLDLAAAAPLMCAGITAWAPLRRAGVSAGMKVGVVGIGGVGHMATKFAKALGAETVAITTAAGKAKEAHKLGADDVIVSTSLEAMARSKERFDLVLDTVSHPHALDGYLGLVRRGGELSLLATPHEIKAMALSFVFRQKRLSGSFIGGLRETQEMLDFCGQQQITAEVERIDIKDINRAWERMAAADVRYRFVIDTETLS